MCAAAMNDEEIARLAFRHVVRSEALGMDFVVTSSDESEDSPVTNDKGRPSKDDIERMVQQAEKYKEENRRQRDKIDARNGLEDYAYSVKQFSRGEKLKDKISPEDHIIIESSCKNALDWLDQNPHAEKEEYDARQKTLEGKINPIMMQAYGGAGDMPGCFPEGAGGPASSSGGAGPNIEEID